ncbi:MAG: LmeA family phospholipid-binding protein [Actinomycetota bacterium]|nr:LmeA family phospholipid-binding protein [Actinomycetota bacterium]
MTGASGPSSARTLVSPDRAWTVGRAADADIVVHGDQVSRCHLVLERAQQDWLVRDVSSNGSWHDGTRIGLAGLHVPRGSEMRLYLGHRTGPQVLIEGPPAEMGDAHTPASAVAEKAMPRRRYRRIGVVLVVLILLLGIADRVAARIASTQAVSQIVQQSQGLARRPSVSFGGFPFLTQVAFGKYTDIRVGIHDITPPGSVRIESISGLLQGAHVPLSTVIRNDVSTIPVDHVAATVALRFADLNSFLAHQPGHLTLAGRHGAVQVTGSVMEGGQTIKVSGSARLGANDAGLVIAPTSLHITGGGALGGVLGDASSLLSGPLSAFPPVPIPLPDLPFHLRMKSVHSDDNGVVAAATADHVVLDAG